MCNIKQLLQYLYLISDIVNYKKIEYCLIFVIVKIKDGEDFRMKFYIKWLVNIMIK